MLTEIDHFLAQADFAAGRFPNIIVITADDLYFS